MTKDWYKTHFTATSVNEDYLKSGTLGKPFIQGEISPGKYNIIDGTIDLRKPTVKKSNT